MNKEKRVLLINPHEAMTLYKKSAIKAAISEIPYLSTAALAGALLKANLSVEILDLSILEDPIYGLKNKLKSYNPTHVGVTFTTPLFFEAKKTADIVKEFDKKIVLICGGAHSTVLPEETLEKTSFDVLCHGESDDSLIEVVNADDISDFRKIKGIYYKDKNKKIRKTPQRPLMEDLDSLAFPAWHLYDVKKYKASRISAKASPVGPIETSRGCVYKCTYCNKSIYGTAFRAKSAKRVVQEFIHLKKSGFKEIHIWDDMFTTDIHRAKKICDELAKLNLEIPWALTCGIRVNNVDQELFNKLKKAGCHAVYFGVESGDQRILDNVKKMIKPEQAKKAIAMANKSGLETVTFFILGLPGETKQSIENTINFAIDVDSLYAKTTILTPYPGTDIFEDFDKKGLILTKDWSKYNFHAASKTFNHPNLTWNELDFYYKKFHRKFYFRPKYFFKRIKWDLRENFLFWDIYYVIKTFF